jgi:hypothetical protein
MISVLLFVVPKQRPETVGPHACPLESVSPRRPPESLVVASLCAMRKPP